MAYTNNTEKKSVNTTGMTTRNPNAMIPTALTVTYWDDLVRVAFARELPSSQRTENRRYDYEHSISTCISRAKCNDLYNQYEAVIKPAIKQGLKATVSVTISGNNSFMLSSGVENEGDTPKPYIMLVKDISAETLTATPANIIKYEFNTGEIILNYNPETGTFDDKIITYTELDLFMKDLNSFRESGSHAYVHQDRVVNKFYKDTINNKLDKIGEKMGLDLAYKPRYGNGGNGGQGSIFDKPSKDANPEQGSATVASMDDIDAAMEGLPFA